jgi:hypothetical protein
MCRAGRLHPWNRSRRTMDILTPSRYWTSCRAKQGSGSMNAYQRARKASMFRRLTCFVSGEHHYRMPRKRGACVSGVSAMRSTLSRLGEQQPPRLDRRARDEARVGSQANAVDPSTEDRRRSVPPRDARRRPYEAGRCDGGRNPSGHRGSDAATGPGAARRRCHKTRIRERLVLGVASQTGRHGFRSPQE